MLKESMIVHPELEFIWNKNFETGLPTVDKEHHKLVDLINELGHLLINKSVDMANISSLFEELIDYADYHFKNEEVLMHDHGLASEFRLMHAEMHKSYIDTINGTIASIKSDKENLSVDLIDFLTHWLAYHILGVDQEMAKQIKLIDSGLSSEEAYRKIEREKNKSTEPLLGALDRLFKAVNTKNQELTVLNANLEKIVEERTQELRSANEMLRKLSYTDELTGLPNRRAAINAITENFEMAKQKQLPLSCMMIDADNFKEVNDEYGHESGDIVIKKLALALLHHIRTDDFVARMGGDEFLVIAPNTDLDGVYNLGNKLCNIIKNLSVSFSNAGKWNSSISIGVSELTDNMMTIDELIKAADESLYLAKERGRNRVESTQIVK